MGIKGMSDDQEQKYQLAKKAFSFILLIIASLKNAIPH